MIAGARSVTMDKITISGIEVYAYHGVLESEKTAGQRFLVDVEITADLAPAARSDDLDRTIDFATVAGEVERLMTAEVCNLVETVAEKIASSVLSMDGTQEVTVTVRKPDAPLPVKSDWVGVSLTRRRGEGATP